MLYFSIDIQMLQYINNNNNKLFLFMDIYYLYSFFLCFVVINSCRSDTAAAGSNYSTTPILWSPVIPKHFGVTEDWQQYSH